MIVLFKTPLTVSIRHSSGAIATAIRRLVFRAKTIYPAPDGGKQKALGPLAPQARSRGQPGPA